MKKRAVILLVVSLGIMLFSGCIANQPVEIKGHAAHSQSAAQNCCPEGVELLIQNTELSRNLVVNNVNMVRGEYLLQLRARISNTGRHILAISTEPVWYDHHGVQMNNVYSQKQVHYLGKGQGISITHDAVSINAKTVRLTVDCPLEGCRKD